jgi:SAM-dependent methyltransferase/uncharacterized protein YbaR (Trm112 family)
MPSAEKSPPSRCGTCRVEDSELHRARSCAAFDCDGCHRLEILSGLLVCENGHVFPVREGVPRLRPDSQRRGDASTGGRASGAEAIAASFSREWGHFDHESARTWHQSLDERCELFLREVAASPGDLFGKVVLDAGCGNGSLSRAISRHGCEVLAVDVSDSVEGAFRFQAARGNDRTHFVQADLAHPPFRPRSFDVVYSSGVLHHNPDTREAFQRVESAVKPGGRYYVWLYRREPGLKFAFQLAMRSLIAPLPAPLKHGFVLAWSVQSMIRQWIRRLLGSDAPEDRLTWRERIVDLLDLYTPRYRWMHTEPEVKSWFRESGYASVETTEVRQWGFGVLGVKAGG